MGISKINSSTSKIENQKIENRKRRGFFRTFSLFGLSLAIGSSLFTACSDDWSDHYSAAAIGSETLWQAISSQQNISNFASVVKACGYDVVLSGSQNYTVFAPTNDLFSSATADSLIREFNQQAADSVKSDDNTVVRQFLQNHITMYKHPVSSLTNDTITLLNNKYTVLTPSQLGTSHILSDNALYSNGILFTIDKRLEYFPNVFEYLRHDKELDSVFTFLNRFSAYEFDEDRSVPGEIIDGVTHYLDSVTYLNNKLLDYLGKINSEDSTYWFLCPTNSEWCRLLTEYEPYFNYPRNIAKRDSLIYTNTRLAIIGGTFFNRSNQPDQTFADSALSTLATPYAMRQLTGENHAYYTYFHPFADGGIFAGATDIACSNGHVLKSDNFSVSKYDTFMQTIKIEAESIVYRADLLNAIDPPVVRQLTSSSPYYNKVSNNAYIEIVPDAPDAKVKVFYKLPNILSNLEYDIYGVFVPATAYDSLAADATKPCRVRGDLYYSDRNGKPARYGKGSNATNNPAVLDTVRLIRRFKFPVCSSGLSEPSDTFSIESVVNSDQTATYTTTVRLDCIILKPHELDN